MSLRTAFLLAAFLPPRPCVPCCAFVLFVVRRSPGVGRMVCVSGFYHVRLGRGHKENGSVATKPTGRCPFCIQGVVVQLGLKQPLSDTVESCGVLVLSLCISSQLTFLDVFPSLLPVGLTRGDQAVVLPPLSSWDRKTLPLGTPASRSALQALRTHPVNACLSFTGWKPVWSLLGSVPGGFR